MTLDELKGIFSVYLLREPSIEEINHHRKKEKNAFIEEVINCPEYKKLHIPYAKDLNIKIAIASSLGYYKKTLPILLPTLIESGVEKERIHIFISGSHKHNKEVIDGYQYYFVNYNSFEYTPLIYIVENNMENQYWFLLHDTCKVGKNFNKLLHNIPAHLPNTITLKKSPSMSIASYKYSFLKSQEKELLSIKNTDYSEASIQKWKKWGVPNEDFIPRKDPTRAIYNNWSWHTVSGNDNWYGTKETRKVEYYNSLDLFKSKANWGQTNNSIMITKL